MHSSFSYTSDLASSSSPSSFSGGGGALLSIIIPCFNEALNLELFYTQVIKQVEILISQSFISSYEFVFVNDGSQDDTLKTLKKLQSTYKGIRTLDFSRNFGKESALLAGLRECRGEYVVLMDADLQDPEWLLPKMFEVMDKKGVDIVCVRRKDRAGDSALRKVLSSLFYKIYGFVSEVKLQNGVRDFRLLKREVVDAILSLKEYHRFSKAIFEWVGFERAFLDYEYIPRAGGDSSFSLYKLFKYGLEGIISFSTMPLRLAFVIGFIVSLAAFIYGCVMIIQTLLYGNAVRGYPSLICVVMFLGGVQLIVLGIIGEYIARIYEQIKNRPHYILKKDKQDEK